jgi:hypothetical protein
LGKSPWRANSCYQNEKAGVAENLCSAKISNMSSAARQSRELSAISFQRSASGEPRHDRSVGQGGMKNLCAAQGIEELVV